MYGREALEAVVKAHPDSFPAVKLLENFHHFVGLHTAIGGKWHNGWGSYLFNGQTYAYQPDTLRKQEELYRYSMTATNALEIGVYVGHSLLLMLLANPTLKITCIDNDEQFARKAVDYLNAHFDNRITFIHADAIAGVASLPADTFDLVHIDADHYDWAVNAQFRASVRVATAGATIVFDDYEAVQRTIDGFVAEGYLEMLIVPGCLWTNCVARLTAKTWEECVAQVCSRFSALSRERLLNNIAMVRYVNEKGIPGDIVEIGVYKGGSMLAMMKAHEKDLVGSSGIPERVFHLYDTFTGMTPPTEADKDMEGIAASTLMEVDEGTRCICSLEDVQATIAKGSGLPAEMVKYHVGDIMKNTYYPERVAVLRLDTDWYESTAHELANFYDLVVPGGVIIIDDYGHWAGARKAVDEFLAGHPEITLQQIDYTGVFFVKPGAEGGCVIC